MLKASAWTIATVVAIAILSTLGLGPASASEGNRVLHVHFEGPSDSLLEPEASLEVNLYDNHDIKVRGPVAAPASRWAKVSFEGLTPGQYKVEAIDLSKTYRTTYSGRVTTLAEAELIDLSGEALSTTIELNMAMGGWLEGRVVGTDGLPPVTADGDVTTLPLELYYATGERVWLGAFGRDSWWWEDWPNVEDGSTDANGRYRFENLPAGDYIVKVGAPGYGIYAPTYSGGAHTHAAAMAQNVKYGETTSAPDIELGVGGSISGRITAPEGLPLPESESAEIFVYDSSGTRVRNAPTYLGIGDTYRFSGLAPGEYRVEARQWSGPMRFVPTYSGGPTNLAEATPISVEMGAEFAGVDIAMVIGGSITGRITGPGGEPIGSVSVGAFASDSSDDPVGLDPVAIQSVETEADGTFRIGALPTGEYFVLAQNSEHISTFFGGATRFESASRVNVELGAATTNADIVMEYGGVIEGVVNAESGGPLALKADIRVSVFDSKGALAGSGGVAADGSYRLAKLRQGWHRLEFKDRSGIYEDEFHENQSTLEYATPVWVNGFGSDRQVHTELSLAPIRPEPISEPPASIPAQAEPTRAQKLPSAPKSLKRKKSKRLPARTGAGISATWSSATPRVCKVKHGRVIAKKSRGVCRVTMTAPGSEAWLPIRQTFRITVR